MTAALALLAGLTWRTSAVVAVGLIAAVMLRRRSAALRHLVLAAGVLSAGSVLPLTVLVPAWHVGVPQAWQVGSPGAPPAAVPGGEAGRALAHSGVAGTAAAMVVPAPEGGASAPVAGLVVFVWLIGAVGGGLRLGAGAFRLARLESRAARVLDGRWPVLRDTMAARLGLTRTVALLAAPSPGEVGTWGCLRPRLLIPSWALGWDDERIEAVLCHELAHVRRGDWALQVAAEGLRAVFWFNPLLWILCRRLRHESERACDDIVLRNGVRADAYAALLLEFARLSRPMRPAWAPVVPMARTSTLEGRITAMLDSRLDRRVPQRAATLVLAAAALCVLVPAATLRLSAQAGPMTVRGAVYDSSGGVLPAVEMSLEDEHGVKWTTPTDGSGQFEFGPVGPGQYVLQASIPGFRTFRQKIALEQARGWNQAITLQLGTLEETISVTARRPQKPAPAPAAAAGRPVRVGGNIRVPAKIKDVAPVYPESMREAGLEGVVPLDVLIGTNGTVLSVRVLSAQVHPAFAKAAADAVRQWVFTPTLLNGVPSEVAIAASIQFSLSD